MAQDDLRHRDLSRQIGRAQLTACRQHRTCRANPVPEILEGIGAGGSDQGRPRRRNPEPCQQYRHSAARLLPDAAQHSPANHPPHEMQRRLDLVVTGRIGNRVPMPNGVGGAAWRAPVEATRRDDADRHGVANPEAGSNALVKAWSSPTGRGGKPPIAW